MTCKRTLTESPSGIYWSLAQSGPSFNKAAVKFRRHLPLPSGFLPVPQHRPEMPRDPLELASLQKIGSHMFTPAVVWVCRFAQKCRVFFAKHVSFIGEIMKPYETLNEILGYPLQWTNPSCSLFNSMDWFKGKS